MGMENAERRGNLARALNVSGPHREGLLLCLDQNESDFAGIDCDRFDVRLLPNLDLDQVVIARQIAKGKILPKKIVTVYVTQRIRLDLAEPLVRI